MKLTAPKIRILAFLEAHEGEWFSPTYLGEKLHPTRMHGSPWASPHCLALVRAGLIRRNKKGHYRYYPKKTVPEQEESHG
jgi:hypothetical protein